MDRNEYKRDFEKLYSDAGNLSHGMYKEARKVIRDWQAFCRKYKDSIGQYGLEHIKQIERDFEKSERYKRYSDSERAWNDAYRGLCHDIGTMGSFGDKLPE